LESRIGGQKLPTLPLIFRSNAVKSPIIQTRNLTRHFGRIIAVDRLNLSIEAGEVFGLLGRNGAGKTTVIKMLTTLLPPSSGHATVAGYDIITRPAAVRRVIGYVPQALSADGELTGYENLLIFARLFDIPRAQREVRIREALAFMGLTEVADQLVKSYSGGMIRKLEIAQSTLHRPQVLFLDEPTVGLDPLARHTIWELLERFQKEYGSTILLTTHYLEEAERLCDRVAIVNRGSVVAIGTPGELKARIGVAATLEDVFARYTSDLADGKNAAYDETSRIRRAVRRLG
jgi:ABC-2 type transport system ATP-binding protein